MPLLTTGKSFIKSLESSGAVAVQAPLEGGFEGRYLRRLRASGYEAMTITARGLGDISAYLTGIHGVRPPHLGKKTIEQQGSVGYVYFVPPMVTTRLEQLPASAKGLVVWIIEGHILSRQEIAYLVELAQQQPKVKIVLELGGARSFQWQPLEQQLQR